MTPRGFRSARLLTAGTSLRIVAVPAIMALVLAGGSTADAIAAALFAAAAITDFFDGYLARRWSVTTPLGSFLDTTADKLLVTGVLVALVDVDRASVWLAALIIGREIAILGLKGVVAADGDVVQPSMLGKWKAALQFVAIGLAILRPGDPVGGQYVDEWAMLLATVVTVVSAIDYILRLSSAVTGPHPPRPAPPRGDGDRPGPGAGAGASGAQVPLGGRPSPSP